MDELLIFLACFLIRTSSGIIPSPSVRSSYVQLTQPEDPRQSNYNFDQRNYYREQPHRSYIIYDADVKSAPGGRDRPQSSSTRSWHLEFNERRRNQPIAPSTAIAHSSVFSNLIQVYDKPQNTYYGDTPNYREPSKDTYHHLSSGPIDVPKYEVIYPYQSEQHYYMRDKLPDNFPTPFYPNKDFDFRDPTITSDIRKNYGFYHTQTVSYPEQEDRATRRDNCNYIRLNEKGYPIGNEICGRSISDIILAPDYPTTGDLVLEHRKRYRGTNQDRSLQSNQLNSFSRRKRNAENMAERFGEFHSYYPSGGCCGEVMATGYGLRPQYRQEFGNRFVSRPYDRERDVAYYGYGSQGQNYYNNEDDVGEETSSNQGLTSLLSNRGRGNRGRFNDDDDEDDDNYNDSREEEQYGRNSNHSKSWDEDSDKRSNGSQGNSRKAISRSNRKNESSSRSSNNNERSSDSQSQVNNKSVNNRRNFRRDDSEDSFSSSGSSNRGSGGFSSDNRGYNSGGFGSGGYSSSSGSGGYNGDGYNRGNGGYNSRNGGYNNRNGGYNSGSGGYNSGSGGFNSGSGGYNSGSGGFNSGSGGYNSGSGGYNSRSSPNNYGYLNNGGSGRSYGNNGNNMQYGSSVRDFNSYQGNENMGLGGQSYWRTSSPYNSNGYSSYGRYY